MIFGGYANGGNVRVITFAGGRGFGHYSRPEQLFCSFPFAFIVDNRRTPVGRESAWFSARRFRP